MKIEKIRKIAEREVIDYQFLVSILSEYARPRDKISEWLKSGDLIRVKKGLYVFGKSVALLPYSNELLANLIYGPSAISLSYALSFYGFIPERVTTLTSITPKRNKSFSTPAGIFTYTYLNPEKYPMGIELHTKSNKESFLIASPEKALCDHICLTDKTVKINKTEDMHAYLVHDMRFDESSLVSLRSSDLLKISKIYNDPRLDILIKFINKWKG